MIERLEAAVKGEFWFFLLFKVVESVYLRNILRNLFFSFDVDDAIESLTITFFESFGVVIDKESSK